MKRLFNRRCLLFVPLLIVALIPGFIFALPVDGVTPVNNRAYVAAIHKLIRGAQSNIRVMAYQAWYYKEFPNSDSNKFIDELIAAKKRGVKVWVFLETSNWDKRLDEANHEFAKRLEAGGIPVFFDARDITSHEKVVVIDDYATMVSSINWSHFSLWLNNEVAAIIWSRPLAKAFSEYMNCLMKQAGHKHIPPTNATDRISTEGFTLMPAQDVILLTNRKYFPEVHKAFQEAEKSIRVLQRQALYYTMVPRYAKEKEQNQGEPISDTNVFLKDLIAAHKRGVDVAVVLDGELRRSRRTGEWRIDARNEDYAIRLLAGGVPVYYDSLTTQTHAKMVIVDDKTVIGSTNWTYNALQQGNEASVLIKSKEITDLYRKYFERRKSEGVRIVPDFDLYSLMRKREKEEKKSPTLPLPKIHSSPKTHVITK